jgi:hypothetical protein
MSADRTAARCPEAAPRAFRLFACTRRCIAGLQSVASAVYPLRDATVARA